MSKEKETVIIVESPAKAKTIENVLGKGYKVVASQGHVRDLPKSKFGVDLSDFSTEYVIIPGKEKVVDKLKKVVKGKKVLLASDLDREGEAIAWHISEMLNLPKKKVRVTFTAITPQTIQSAVKNVKDINMNLVHSQFARRILDRIVGYKISPLLWKIFRINSLSAGRVQSAVLKLICEREKKIFKFKPKEYWKVIAVYNGNEFELVRKNGKKVEKDLTDEDVELLKNQKELLVADVAVKRTKKNPPEPFITSTLQQAAASKLGFSVKKTMMLAQQLYEGLDTPEGHRSFITYHRTDSTRISEEALDAVRSYISGKFGESYIGVKTKSSKKKVKVQDAHEAIRPVDPYLDPEKAKKLLSDDHYKLYKMIWERFVASQMAPSEREEMKIVLSTNDGVYEFQANFSKRVFDGFEKLLPRDEKIPPELNKGKLVKLDDMKITKEKTKPPDRYTEGSLVKEMEKLGIGRPSTYAPTISTLLSRKYVIKVKRTLYPTILGFLVLDYLEKYFKEIVDVKFTAEMEKELDEVESGEKEYKVVLKEFLEKFDSSLKEAMKEFYKVEYKTNVKCECGKEMVLNTGKFGLYLKCPKCGKTKSVYVESPAVVIDGRVYVNWGRDNEGVMEKPKSFKRFSKRSGVKKKGSISSKGK